MSQPTDKYRNRTEENRLSNLERQVAKLCKVNGYSTNLSVNIRKTNIPFMLKTDAQKTSSSTTSKETSIEPNKSSLHQMPNFDSSNAVAYKDFNNAKYHYGWKGNCIKGHCEMFSRQRFSVDVSNPKELVNIFKLIPSNQYDTKSNKWNFLLKDYENLMSDVKTLNAHLEPLPPLILQTFASASEKKFIKEHNLSSLDPTLLKSLLPFQIEGVNFGIQKQGRVLIADDMGLGKTIQAIAICDYFKDWPLLVVTPSSLKYFWKESFRKWLPSIDLEDVTVINAGNDDVPNDRVILISYDLLSRKKQELLDCKFNSIIFDESHYLKSSLTMRSKAAVELVKNIKRVIMLSGTPALSRPIELYTQLSSLRPKCFFRLEEFGVRYCDGKMGPYDWDYSGSSRMEELQLLLEEMVMIRRLKSDVLNQLPPKIRQMIFLDPSLILPTNQMKRCKDILEYFDYTGDVKLEAVCNYISYLLDGGKKFLCFAHHRTVLKGLCKVIENKKIDFIYVDGLVPSKQRKRLYDRFQLNDSCKVAVLSITAANCGITLTAASLVVFAELFWNPGILTQAEDRAYRIGQENSVVVQYLVALGTADDKIWPIVQNKLDFLNKAGLCNDDYKSLDIVMCEEEILAQDYNDINFSKECSIPEKREEEILALKSDDINFSEDCSIPEKCEEEILALGSDAINFSKECSHPEKRLKRDFVN